MTFLLAHLSDAHIGPLPRPLRRELVGKRLTGYINWRGGRALNHDMPALARIVADIRAQSPDHVAMTGDILNIGLPAEFPFARAWLETLGPAQDVSFVPGNHDAYVRGSLAELARTFVPWTTGDGGETTYPYMRVRGGVALIGLSSGVPTPPFIASGRLGARQRRAVEALLAAAAERGLIRVVMLHHPLSDNGPGLARSLNDTPAFERVIRRVGAELIIHGHNHRLQVRHVAGPGGRPVPVVGVVSASMLRRLSSHRAGYNLFEISGDLAAPIIIARARGVLAGAGEIGDLGPISLTV